MSKKLVRYKVLPSDSSDWVIIELLDKHIKLDIQKEVLTTRYDCIPHIVDVNGEEISCSKYCCYAGCYITPHEIEFIEKILPDLKKNGYLPKDSLSILETYRDEFYLPEDFDEEENLCKTRCAPIEPPEESFLMDPDEYSDEEEEDGEEKEEKDKDEDSDEEWTIDWDADENSDYEDLDDEEDEDDPESDYRAELNRDFADEEEEESEDPPEIDSGVEYEIEWDSNSNIFDTNDKSEKPNIEPQQKKKSYAQNYENSIEKVPESHCLFLMDNGLCSIHKYCSDMGLDWTLHKFNICTTFPMDLRVAENETALDVPYPKNKRVNDDCNTLKMMDEYKTFPFVKMNCINLHDSVKKELNVPYIAESMKYAIVSRYGEEMWIALNDYARRYRKETIKN